MKLERLSRDEFDRLAALTRLPENSKAMAAAVLVDGRVQVDVAAEWGVQKQLVSRIVASINRVYMASTTASDGVVRLSLELPESLALELGTLLESIKKSPDTALVFAAVAKANAGIRSAIRLLK